MLTILVLFVGLTLATAVIAYWSDNLGKKLGKKRVSLWGMRPRTTATFLTIASSWLIMIFTLGVMLGLFPLLRQSLLYYDEVRTSVKKLKKSKTELTGQVGDLGGQVKTLTASFDQASESLKSVGEKLKQSSAAATRARGEQKSAESEAAAAKARAAKSRASEQAAIGRERAARENLTIVTNQRDATQKQRETAQRELKSAQLELKSASAEVKAADARVKIAQSRVKIAQSKAKNADLQFQKAQANADAADKRAANASKRAINVGKQAISAGKQVVEADKKIAEAQKAFDILQAQREQLIRLNAQLSDDKKLSDLKRQLVQGSDIRVPVGFTLDARTFEPGLSFNEAMQRLHGIFDYVANTVLPGTEDYPPVLPGAELRLAVQYVPLSETQSNGEVLSARVEADEIYESLATAISRSQTPLSVRLVADRNHFKGEPFLDVRFTIVPQRPALAADTELASTTFGQSISDAQLFSALLKLTDEGREVALKNGVTPPLSPDAKDFFAPGANERIFEALRKISAMNGSVRVRLLTDKEISTTDQLSIRFDVEPAAPETAAISASKAPA